MVAVYLFSFIGSGSHIVIIPLTDGCCVYMFHVKENIYKQLSSVREMITISEPLPVKENIHTQLSSVRGMITI
jgi:hypothetical protein